MSEQTTFNGFMSNNEKPSFDFDISDKDFEVTQENQEPPVLEVQETVEEVVPETVVEEVVPEVTNQPEAVVEPETPVQTQIQDSINDDSVLNFLSAKLGRDIKSLDDLSPKQVDPLEQDPYLKGLVDWRNKTGRPIEDWYKYQKNYSEMSDIDVVRESLQLKYPMLTPEEVEAEIQLKFISDEDFDTPQQVLSKSLEIKKAAHEGRQLLNELKADLGKPDGNFGLTDEVKADLEIARLAKETQANQAQSIQIYSEGINQASTGLSKLSLKLSDNLAIDYNVSEQVRKDLPDFINTMPHWKDANGGMNYKAVAEDSLKIKHFEDIMKIVYEQGLSAGKEELLKTTNNVNLEEPIVNRQPSPDAPVVEGLDRVLGSGVNKIRFK